jgi:hypothetical protein
LAHEFSGLWLDTKFPGYRTAIQQDEQKKALDLDAGMIESLEEGSSDSSDSSSDESSKPSTEPQREIFDRMTKRSEPDHIIAPVTAKDRETTDQDSVPGVPNTIFGTDKEAFERDGYDFDNPSRFRPKDANWDYVDTTKRPPRVEQDPLDHEGRVIGLAPRLD